MVIKVAVPNQFKLKIIPGIRTFLFPDHREIHYIGGSEILPAPLSPEKEEATIRSLKNGDANEARKLLIEHNLRLVVYIAKKFDNTSWCGRSDFHRNDRTDQSDQYVQSGEKNQACYICIQMH